MRLNEKQYKELFSNSLNYKTNKYHNKKVYAYGRWWDSKKELSRYKELKLMEDTDYICELECQKKFELQPAFKDNNGKTQRKISYICDFFYYDCLNEYYVAEDVKSEATAKDKVYCIKKKMFMYQYTNIVFKEIL